MNLAAFRTFPGRTLCAGLLAPALFALTPALPDGGLCAAAAEPSRPVSLAELAGAADVIALAQVRDTDYLRRRDIPVSGSAYLAVLIAYKSLHAGDVIEVYEKGLREFECYFPNPTVFEEGRRYFVFLRRDPENAGRYRGQPQGCAIEVLIDRSNRYAVRVPVTGVHLTEAQREELAAAARAVDFGDPYAIVDDEALPPEQRDAMAAAGHIVPYPAATPPAEDAPAHGMLPSPPSPPRQWRYTQGIPLEQFRELLHLEPDP
jgi:hypothetical protein